MSRSPDIIPIFHALDDVDGAFSANVIVGIGSLTEARTSTICNQVVLDDKIS